MSTLQRLTTAAFAIASVFAAVITAAWAEDHPDTIRFGGFGQGFGKPYGLAVLAIAQGKGFIEDEFRGTPTKLSFEYFTGVGPAINEAIANKRLDFAQYGALPNIVGKANGLPTRIIASYGQTNVFGVARKELPIASFKDLKGRRVAVAKGTILHWAFLKALQENDLSLRDITLLDLKDADQLASLTAGSVDAAVSTGSHLVLVEKGIAKVFYASKDIGPKSAGFGAITVTEVFEAKYPEAVQKVANGLVRAARWISEEGNREEVYQIWSKSGVSLASLRSEFDGAPLKSQYNPRVDDFFVSQYRDAIAFAKENKLIRSDIDLQIWFAPKYVEQALATEKIEHFWLPRKPDGSDIP